MIHSIVTATMTERLDELGGVSADRIRVSPPPGSATVDDLIAANDNGGPLCELVDHTLVEKAMGYEASIVAMAIAEVLRRFIAPRKLGLVSGPDGFFRLLTSAVRGPDVAFVSRERLPDGKVPKDSYPELTPDLAVEVLSPGNTKREMSRKRIEYFHSGVTLVWIVDCEHRSVAVYTSPDACQIFTEDDTITAEPVLPGFSNTVAEFFTDLDLGVE